MAPIVHGFRWAIWTAAIALLLGFWPDSPIRTFCFALTLGAVAALLTGATVLALSVTAKDDPLSIHYAQARLESWDRDLLWLSRQERRLAQPVAPASFIVSEGIDELLSLLVRDLVTTWHQNISRRPAFPQEVDATIRHALANLSSRLESLDLVEVAVTRTTPILTRHLHEFAEAERAVRGKDLTRNMTASEELDRAIASRYQNGILHPAASFTAQDPAAAQAAHLQALVSRALPSLLPPKYVQSRATNALIREIMCGAILGPLFNLLVDTDTWNQLLEAYGKLWLHDRKSVRKLRAALDEHASPAPKSARNTEFPRLGPGDDQRQFERFMRGLRHCQNLSDARRLRSELSSQIARERLGSTPDMTYLRRLETGRGVVEKRLAKLDASTSPSKMTSVSLGAPKVQQSRFSRMSLTDILRDVTGLSYFMEFMDRQQLVNLVQFWLLMDGFREPLEDDIPVEDAASVSGREWTEADRLDISQISDSYLNRPELHISDTTRDAVRQFLRAGINASPQAYARARALLLRSQSEVLEELQRSHFTAFRQSDLYYKLLTSETPSKASRRSLDETRESTDSMSSVPMVKAQSMGNVNSVAGPLQADTLDASLSLSASQPRSEAQLTRSTAGPSPSRTRRSLDSSRSAPLFDDDIEYPAHKAGGAGLSGSMSQLLDRKEEDPGIVSAMEAALNTIITDEDTEMTLEASEPNPRASQEVDSESLDADASMTKSRPNLASLGLVNTSSRIGVFTDNDLFDDEERFPEDEHADSAGSADDGSAEEVIHEAEPGDLGLSEAIAALTLDIDRLTAQESVVDTLNRKAELTNNLPELRILGKSKSSLQREIRRKELQRQQYIIQESDNSLYGRARVRIKSIVVGHEDEGQEFAIYVIEVIRSAFESLPAASWAVARRYSEFHVLNQRLRRLHPAVRNLHFPRRRLVLKLQSDFLQKRKVSLERYLAELLKLPDVCRSRELRAFLSLRPIMPRDSGAVEDKGDLVSRIYSSVTDGMDEFLGNIPVLDQLSLAGQNLIAAAASQYAGIEITASPEVDDVDDRAKVGQSQAARAELNAFDDQTALPFVKPICDFFLETFELNRAQNWLRGRAVVVVLHQLLGGTVERRMREMADTIMSESSLARYLGLAKQILWPQGTLQLSRNPRDDADRKKSRREASVVLAALLPELTGSVVGRSNAQAAARRVFATLNNRWLNTHVALQLLDEAFHILFPETEQGGR